MFFEETIIGLKTGRLHHSVLESCYLKFALPNYELLIWAALKSNPLALKSINLTYILHNPHIYKMMAITASRQCKGAFANIPEDYIAAHPEDYQNIAESTVMHEELGIIAVRNFYIRTYPAGYKKLVLAAVKAHMSDLRHVNDKYTIDHPDDYRDIVFECLNSDANALKYVNPNYAISHPHHYKAIVLAAIQGEESSVFQNIHPYYASVYPVDYDEIMRVYSQRFSSARTPALGFFQSRGAESSMLTNLDFTEQVLSAVVVVEIPRTEVRPYLELTEEQHKKVIAHIERLNNEIQSSWPYPNKERKKDKVVALEQLISYAKNHSLAESVLYSKEQHPNAVLGIISTRTADLLDELTAAADRKSNAKPQ